MSTVCKLLAVFVFSSLFCGNAKAGFNDLKYIDWDGTVETTNASSTEIISKSATNNSIYIVTAQVTGGRFSGDQGSQGDTSVYEIKAAFKRVAGGDVVIQKQTKVFEDEDNAATNAGFTVSGTDIKFNVQGDTGNDYSWVIFIDGMVLSQ